MTGKPTHCGVVPHWESTGNRFVHGQAELAIHEATSVVPGPANTAGTRRATASS